MVNKASTRVETMLGEAGSTAETLHRLSWSRPALLEQDAARTHADTLAVFNRDKTFLENTIDDLRGFEQHYRIQLTLYLQSLLYELERAHARGASRSDTPWARPCGFRGGCAR